MKNKNKLTKKEIAAILILIGIVNLLVGLSWQTYLRFTNIDMTDLRLVAEYPVPTIQMMVGGILTVIGKMLF